MHLALSQCEADTQAIARVLAAQMRVWSCVTLQGEVGAGKTVFARALIRALVGSEIQVNSPTFTLVQTYPVILADGTKTTLHHYDLYRLQHPSELIELALDEALESGVVVMEWPELAEEWLPQDTLRVQIEQVDESTRSIRVTSF